MSFAPLADDLRVGILRALWRDETLSVPGRRDAVEAQDSGRFTPHLDTLVGQFVTDRQRARAHHDPDCEWMPSTDPFRAGAAFTVDGDDRTPVVGETERYRDWTLMS